MRNSRKFQKLLLKIATIGNLRLVCAFSYNLFVKAKRLNNMKHVCTAQTYICVALLGISCI